MADSHGIINFGCTSEKTGGKEVMVPVVKNRATSGVMNIVLCYATDSQLYTSYPRS